MVTRRARSFAYCIISLTLAAAAAGQTARRAVKICRGVPIPEGYTVVGDTTSPDCPRGAYLIKQDEDAGANAGARQDDAQQPAGDPAVYRPRRAAAAPTPTRAPAPSREPEQQARRRPPTLAGATGGATPAAQGDPVAYSAAGPEEVGADEVVRVDTTLITVPVSVTDRQGRYVPNLKREDFHLFENGVEQQVAFFDSADKPFTVALLLDTSGSTRFRLWDIKDAAIEFARQLRPQDRVLVVTFNEQVLLLTEATSDRNIINGVITYNARSGDSTRLYDAVDLVIRERLNKIQGRKAIVLFTDGVDTTSQQATYESTLGEVSELDALIYPIQYDTFQDMQPGGGSISIVSSSSSWPFGGQSSSRVVNLPASGGSPAGAPAGSAPGDYERADKYLHNLAEETGGRVYRADDPGQLARAFSMIAEELRRQYSLGYYPKEPTSAGQRREIRVRVRQPGLAVRARDSYVTGK